MHLEPTPLTAARTVPFPKVDPGILSPEQKAEKNLMDAQHEAWRALKIMQAVTLARLKQQPYVKPARAVIERRRKAGKAARKARRNGR